MNPASLHRILVVEDDPAVPEILGVMLAEEFHLVPGGLDAGERARQAATANGFPRFQIDSAMDGSSALTRLREAEAAERPYTMAFVDLDLREGWSGVETISRLWRECFDLQVIVCAGPGEFSWLGLMERFGHSGQLLVLRKPLDMTEVRQTAYALAEKWTLAHQANRALERLQRLVGERTAKLEEANRSLQRKVIENKQAEHRLMTQYAVTQALAECCTSADAAERVFVIVCASLHWDWGGLWSADPQANVLRLADSWRVVGSEFEHFEKLSRQSAFAPGHGLPGQVWRSGQAVWVQDILQDTTLPRAQAAAKDGLHGAIAFPIRVDGKVFGVMEFFSREVRERDLELMQTFTVIGSSLGQFMERIKAEDERRMMEIQLRQAHKLESIGHLAAGIAHEINTPTQYIGDNIRFLETSFADLHLLHGQYEALLRNLKQNGLCASAVAETEAAIHRADVDFLIKEIPQAIEQALTGVKNVARIVRAMKDFSHPGTGEKVPIDLNRAIETTLTVAANEWKYVADATTDFDEALPLVPCLPGEFHQVMLNLIVNAAHAIGEVVCPASHAKGAITISTRGDGEFAEVRVKDTGVGIAPKNRSRIFEPFFTTKPVGKGTGQGLALARAVIVEQHGGSLTFETELGAGSVFIIRLPVRPLSGIQSESDHETSTVCR